MEVFKAGGKANETKEKLLNWRNELISKLDHKENESTEIILIDKDIIDNDVNAFFNTRINDIIFKKLIESDNSKLNKELNEKSNFYILNGKFMNYLLEEKNSGLKVLCDGYFLNKILLIIKAPNFFFLYLDNKKKIKKGYFKLSNETNDLKNNIINFFRENEPIQKDNFFNEYGIKYEILEDNSIFENKNVKEGNKLEKNILWHKSRIRVNSFNESINKNIDKKIKNPFDFQSGKFKNNDKEIRIYPNKKMTDEHKRRLIERTKIPINYHKQKIPVNYHKQNIDKKNNELNNNIKPLTQIKQNEKENLSLNMNVNVNANIGNNLKELFDPKKVIIKRNPSVQNPKISSKTTGDKNSKFNLEIFFPKKAVHRTSTPGVIGLSKIGDIPFINPIIQCFSNIQRFKSELLAKETYINLEQNKSLNTKLSFALAEVLKNLWENLHISVYEPKNFIKVMQEINPNLDEIFKEPLNLIEFLLKEIHYELNKPQNLGIVMDQDINIFQNNDITQMFNNYKKKYELNDNSIISKEFKGHYIDIKQCLNCNYSNFNINSINAFKFLNFSLDQIKNFKNYNINCISIYDCFDYYEKKQQLIHSCNKCGFQMNKFSKLLNMPNTLILNFENKENRVKLIYEEYLNLKKYIYFNNSPFYYELIGVICNAGSSNEKNFIAYCKNEKCEWYKYNDNKVTKISFREIEDFPNVLFFSYIQV